MTNLLARILLAMIMFPLAALIYLSIFLILEKQMIDDYAFLWTTIFTAYFVVLYWLILWRQFIRWTRKRKINTLLASVGCLAVGAGVGMLVSNAIRYGGVEFVIVVGGAIAVVLWLALSVLIWRETASERAERVRQSAGNALFCPKCGYNMTGLYEGRCPECGTRYTLDQLYSAQRREEIGDVAEAMAEKAGQS